MRNWKTTAIGFVGALLYAVAATTQDGVLSFQEITTALTTAALGFFAKDFNVSGK